MDKLEYDRLGFRLKLGVIVPSTNTCVQPEFDDMRPRGVTNHVARIMLKDAQQMNDQQQAQVMDDIEEDFLGAIDRVMTCDPGAIVLGMSLPTFWGGVPACDQLKARIEAHAGIPVFMGSQACIAALKMFPDVKRLGVITPYQPIGDRHVTTFFPRKRVRGERDPFALAQELSENRVLRRSGLSAIPRVTRSEAHRRHRSGWDQSGDGRHCRRGGAMARNPRPRHQHCDLLARTTTEWH